MRPSVFLVAGNRLLREALAKLLHKRGKLNVCGACLYSPDIYRSIRASGADVAILDSVTAQQSNCAVISEILGQVPKIKIVLIDMVNDPDLFLECVRAGAVGYLLEDASAAEVVSGVEAVAQGQAVCHPQLCKHLFRAYSRQWTSIASAQIKMEFGLTRRQHELVPLIAQGLTNKEIAAQLHLSEQTVKNHIRLIKKRVGADDRPQIGDLAGPWGGLN